MVGAANSASVDGSASAPRGRQTPVRPLEVAGERHRFALLAPGPDGVRVRHEGVNHPCSMVVYADGTVCMEDSSAQTAWIPQLRLPDGAASAAVGLGSVSELPGTVVAVAVRNESVRAGQTLVESMKVEHPARAAVDGVVKEIHVNVGHYVEATAVPVSLGEVEG